MDYKKCEFCGEEIHIRSQKCPFCGKVVSEEPIVMAEPEEKEPAKEEKIEEVNEVVSQDSTKGETPNYADNSENETPVEEANKGTVPFDFAVGGEPPKDYVYKAEVRHSIEYTRPLSNWIKVFTAAFCTVPFLGQIIGAFLGVYYSTYEDQDKSSFGKAMIALSIGMFLFYVYYIKQFVDIVGPEGLQELLNTVQ